jgi:hypothetical protein
MFKHVPVPYGAEVLEEPCICNCHWALKVKLYIIMVYWCRIVSGEENVEVPKLRNCLLQVAFKD